MSAVQGRFGFLAPDAFAEDVHQHQVGVGAARDDVKALLDQGSRQGLGVGQDLLLVDGELRGHGLQKAHRLGGNDMHQGPALHSWKHRLVDGLAMLFAGQDHAPARPPQRLMGSCSDDVGPKAGVGMHPARHQSGEVRHVHQQQGAGGVGDGPDAGEVDHPRIRAAAGDNHLRLMLLGQALHLVVVQRLGVLLHPVRKHLVRLARKVKLMSMREVSAVGQVHAQDGVPRLQDGGIGGQVRARARVRLDVHVLGSEDLLRPLPRQLLHLVHVLAPAVIALSRIPLGVLVGQHRSGRLQHRLGDEVLAGDQLQVGVLAQRFFLYCVPDVGIGILQRAGHDHDPRF